MHHNYHRLCLNGLELTTSETHLCSHPPIAKFGYQFPLFLLPCVNVLAFCASSNIPLLQTYENARLFKASAIILFFQASANIPFFQASVNLTLFLAS